MASFNPDKKIQIEIRQIPHAAFDYEVWAIAANKCICRNADENQIIDVLTLSQFDSFLRGKYTFTVTANDLATTFGYLY